MKFFISHSLDDIELLKAIQEKLATHELQLLIAEHVFYFNYSISEKIIRLIDQCDVGLILLTKNGINSQFVSEEIGYLEARKKPIIRVIEKGFSSQYSGFKYGADFIELDPENPTEAYNRLVKALLQLKEVIITKRNAWLIVGSILLIFAFSQVEE